MGFRIVLFIFYAIFLPSDCICSVRRMDYCVGWSKEIKLDRRRAERIDQRIISLSRLHPSSHNEKYSDAHQRQKRQRLWLKVERQTVKTRFDPKWPARNNGKKLQMRMSERAHNCWRRKDQTRNSAWLEMSGTDQYKCSGVVNARYVKTLWKRDRRFLFRCVWRRKANVNPDGEEKERTDGEWENGCMGERRNTQGVCNLIAHQSSHKCADLMKTKWKKLNIKSRAGQRLKF